MANGGNIQGTTDVRLDPQLNKKVWESGIKGTDYRLRIRISRKRNDEEGAKEKLYSYVQAVNVKSAKGLQTTLVEDAQIFGMEGHGWGVSGVAFCQGSL